MSSPSPIRIAVAAILAAAAAQAAAQSVELPVPCVAGVCGANITGFVTSGRATATSANNVLRVQQQSDRAILNWASFNVGADGRVIFEQPGAGSIALNRIFQGSPSRILGAIEANGQIYLVNQNGFLFGPTARVRTSGLLVSSLNMTDATFENGLLSPELLRNSRAALESDNRVGVLDAQGNPVMGDDGQPLKVQIKIEAGARLSTTGEGGRVMLASRTVDNAGDIDTPDGQAVLAAGEKVYLQASTDPALRGLLVEVDAGGEAWNRMTGNISAARGNVTMIGLAVNQHGRASATSTVSANGSIRLLARDSVQFGADASGLPTLSTNRGGRLELGADSQTTVLPELDNRETAIDEQTQLPSSIELTGRQLFVRGGAKVRAPGGDIALRAVNDSESLLSHDAEARVRVESGAVIDASGSDATVSVSRNVVRVELRGNELRDAPLQRDGALRGKEVFIDARVGTPLADVSGAIAGIGRAIDERTSAGGNIVVESAGDIVVAPGATFDVSGGVLNYTGAAVQTTQLLTADGRAVDIGQANANQLYVGLINPSSRRSFDRWGVTEQVQGPLIGRYEPGYVEGKSAGTVQFAGRGLALNGSFLGGVTTGPDQRVPALAPLGGRFIVGAPDAAADSSIVPDFFAPSINLVDVATPVAVGDDGSLPQRPLDLSTRIVTSGGFTQLDLNSNGVVHIPEAMQLALAVDSSLRITAHRVEVEGSVSAPGGSLQFASELTVGVDNSVLPRAGVVVSRGSTLDVRGLWNNELSLLTPIYPDGGEIDLAVRAIGGELVLGDGTRLLADGGASMSTAGTVTGGRGGSIALRAGAGDGALEVGEGVLLSAFGVANARGGSLTLEAPRIEIVAGDKWSHAQRLDLAEGDDTFFTLGDGLFSNFGFASFDIAATGPRITPAAPEAPDSPDAPNTPDTPDTLVVRSGARIDARARTRQLDEGVAARSGGGTVEGFAREMLAPDYQRSATSVALRVEPRNITTPAAVGRLSIERDASIRTDVRGSVSLTSVGGITVSGSIIAPGGSVTASIPNPTVTTDPGYRPDLGISIFDDAVIDVAGLTIMRPNDAGLLSGDVLAGGTVNLLANRGFVAAERGASFELGGGSGFFDVPGNGPSGGYLRRQIGGAGGALTVRAPESLSFSASLHAAAGAGDTSSPGGSATFQLTRQRGFQFVATDVVDTFSTAPRTLLVTANTGAVSSAQNGIGVIDVNLLRNAGIDALSLEAGNRIEFYDGANLSLGRSLSIAAPIIGVSGDRVSLRAPVVSFGTVVDTSILPASTSIPGVGRLDVSGDLVELTGFTTLTGIANATFTASRELRLRGFENAGTSRGELRTAGDLTLRAPLIYPTTATQFSIVSSGGANDVVRFESPGPISKDVPLSVGGSLSVTARSIVQGTRISAPFGSIDLNANADLTLADNSVTSVSAGDRLLPFGRVQIGSEWIYLLGGTQITAPRLPTPGIELTAADVTLAGTATVDLEGGGDLYAYEWLPGTGGSRDALAAGAIPGLYAILPELRDGFAPYDPQEFTGTDLKPGDSIYLSGADGLPAGVYPLLPARYALLPGALLVSAVPGTTDAAPGVATRLADGSAVISGYRTFAGSGIRDARTTGFVLRPGSYGRSLASYQDSRASTFDVENRPVAPDDAGRLGLFATHSFDLAGRVLSAANDKGTGSAVDIAAPNLALRAAGAPDVAGAVNVDAAILQSWNAGSLLLGGRRDGDRTISVTSDTLTFGTGAQLTAAEIIAVAHDSVRLDSGVTLTATGAARASEFDEKAPLRLAAADSGAAVLGVSGTRALTVERDGSASGGVIETSAGSRIASAGSLLLDAPDAVRVAGTIAGDGATWTLGSDDITFGGVAGDGLTLVGGLLDSLAGAGRARLGAAHAITFTESLMLGGFDELVLDSPLLRASAPGLDVRLAADSLTLLNRSESPALPMAAMTGDLQLSARDVVLGPGSMAVTGFSRLAISAEREIVGQGDAHLATGGDATLTAANIGAGSDANLEIAASGALNTRAAGALASSVRVTDELGGRIALSSATIDHAGAIRVSSGRVELSATTGLNVAKGSVLDVSGVTVNAAGRTVGSGGGTLRLTSGGTLDLQQGSRLRVAGAGNADAGGIQISSVGAAQLGGIFDGRASANARGGSFAADAASITDFFGLNAALESGGFSERRALHFASGDLTLAAGQTLVARDVSLSTGTGRLTIAGTIDASSDNQRGRIELSGGSGLTLASGAQLTARGTGVLGRGGDLVLASTTGTVDLGLGSVIALGGSRENGHMTVRAAATADGMQLGAFDSAITGVDVVALQPVLNFDLVNAPGAAAFDTIFNAVTNYTNVAGPALQARLASSAIPVAVRPGIDLHTNGDLTLGSLDLAAWRFGGEAAALAFSATGDISIAGEISDGVRLVDVDSNPRLELLADRSSSLSFDAGRNLLLGADSRVRTGTGDITLRAGNDIRFENGASVWTAGLPALATHVFARGASFGLPTSGGRVALSAGNDVVGAPVTQAVGAWQIRQGRQVILPTPSSPGWGTDIQAFGWNLGTFGGGDIDVRAGGSIRELSAAAADSASLVNGQLQQFGGGVIELDAGDDINSVFLHVTRGDNVLRAGGALSSSRQDAFGALLGSLFSMQEASIDILARRGIEIESVINPTLLTQGLQGSSFRSFFLSFAPDSQLRARSATGDISLHSELGGVAERLTSFVGAEVIGENDPALFAMLPPSLQLEATDGDIRINAATTMAPAERGQLELFARNDIVSPVNSGSLSMSDAAAASIPSKFGTREQQNFVNDLISSAASGLHALDDSPALVNAGHDILRATFFLPKFARFAAGRDIRNSGMTTQNVRTDDATLISAGRDLIFDRDAGNRQIQIGGPGRLDIVAGRDVDLGFSTGISTVGRIVNPALTSEQGADITVLAGAGGASAFDLAAFMAKIVSPSVTYRSALQDFVASITGSPAGGFDAAATQFGGLAEDLQRAFLIPVFFGELVASGREVNTIPGAGFDRGYAAIDALFPGSRNPAATPRYDGDLKLAFSRIYTLADADISLLVPGGLLNVGLANPPPGLAGTRKPSDLGIVAQRAGSVRIFTSDDVLVNQSRVFTLRGGDIAIWSTDGDIDAGRGAKSAISAPPPTILVDASGRVTLDFAGAVAGSGIRAIVTDDDVHPGDVDLIAPSGIVDAGDAGIGSAGNLNVAAQQVVGLDNIQVGGTSSGVPAETSSLGASLSGASAVASSATSAASDTATVANQPSSAPLADSVFGFLDVFLEGFGSEVCKPDDTECLKRN